MTFVLKRGERIGIDIKSSEEAVKIACENLKRDLSAAIGVEAGDGPAKIVITTEKADAVPESFSIKVKDGVLYITGADRRGMIYGIYTLSEMTGVSPWYYFADVPIKKRDEFSLPEGYEFNDSPTIPYRGIFINDEEELDKWARLHMDEPTIGVHTYEKIFELILRLKGNYIWPAMHVNSFNLKPENGALANRMGLVVGTSHCDMLMRSNYREWEPWIQKKGYTDARYDYSFEGKNREILKEYWRESAEQNRDFEVSYTLGMRGIHDSGFVTEALKADSDEELKEKKVALLEQVINDQKQILREVTGKDPFTTFVPYKEVMTLYDRGLKVPDDVTLIWTNDNYGYVRRYPSEKERKRPGGHGIYYHNSYWAPTLRHYLFISSYPIAQTKYEMDKAYENGIRKLWVCNMGALKPLEQEMEFFLKLGWDYGKKNAKVNDPEIYLADWIDRNFSGNIGTKTAKLLDRYARVSNTRKVEMFEEDAFSQDIFKNEAAIRLNTLKEIYDEGNDIYDSLPADEKDAFFEMVLMKIHAAYYTAAMYYFADRSNLCFKAGRHEASRKYTGLSQGFEDLRRSMLYYYNRVMADGKWNGILTPEDFPPPRTAMHPACTPSLAAEAGPKDEDFVSDVKAISIDATKGKLSDCRIIKGLGRGSVDLLEISDTGSAEYEFEADGSETFLQIYRYPSLNSVVEIFVHVSPDGKESMRVQTEASDEWRGTWEQNVMDNVDRLTVSLGSLTPGKHVIRVFNGSRYFAFSKIVISFGQAIADNLGALLPNTGDYAGGMLPDETYYHEARKAGYANMPCEYVIPVGSFVYGRNVSDATDRKDYTGLEKELFMPSGILSAEKLTAMGSKAYGEHDGNIIIDAFGAYNNTKYAKMNGPWEYSTGVSYSRSNLALYIRKRGLVFDRANAPSLSYRFNADGGEYTVWVLMKYSSHDAAKLSMFLDGEHLKSAWGDDTPWRYEGEQPFRYVPFVNVPISAGEHELKLEIYASTLRIERIILSRIEKQ